MKLLLLILTAFALVSTSGVYALGLEQPSALRGSDVMVALQASCEDGYKDGQKEIRF